MSLEHAPQKGTRGASTGAAGFRINELPLGRTKVYELIATGHLHAVKVGGATIVTNWFDYLRAQPKFGKAA